MIFRITYFHFPTNYKPYLSFEGDVAFDSDGNRHFRAKHMSRFSSESSMNKSSNALIGTKNAGGQTYTGWNLEVFPDAHDFADLLHRLAPISISPFISP